MQIDFRHVRSITVHVHPTAARSQAMDKTKSVRGRVNGCYYTWAAKGLTSFLTTATIIPQ